MRARARAGRAAAMLAACTALVLAVTPSAHAARVPLETAIDLSASFSGSDLGLAFERIQRSGASRVKLVLEWRAVAPGGASRPSGFDAANPGDPRYGWAGFDRLVRSAVAQGLEPYITISEAPEWAERGQGGRPGTNNPDPAEFALFARAAATRYGGNFAGLPRVREWEAWNEPNASFFLYPQWEGDRLLSPDQYRKLVNAFTAAIHGVHADNEVIVGALFPFTVDRPASQSIGPLRFMRALLCMNEALQPTSGCEPVHFNIWSHHPYTSGSPTHVAGNPDSVSIRELPRMARLLRAAQRAGHVVSARRVRFWVTEFAWDSNPPDPGGVPTRLHARWVSEAIYRMWRAGVSVVTWFKLRDEPIGSEPNKGFQSGLYFRCSRLACDSAKPALTAWRFPFVAFRSGRGHVRFWGRTPGGGNCANLNVAACARPTVIVEQRVRKRWKRVARLRAGRYGIFSRRARRWGRGRLRARLARGGKRSRSFSLHRPPDRPVSPFG